MGKITDMADSGNGTNIYKVKQSQNLNKSKSRNTNLKIKGARTIFAFAATLVLGSAVIHHTNINGDGTTQETSVQYDLQKDELMEEVESKILDCVFGENLSKIDNPEVSYIYDKHDGSSSLIVRQGKDNYQRTVYSYSDNLSLDGFLNDKNISSLIKDAIDIHYAEDPSQKELESLKTDLDNCNNTKYTLKNGHIVEDKDIEQER
jgi:hypothetical protein